MPRVSPDGSLSTDRHGSEAISVSATPFSNTTWGGQGRIELFFHHLCMWGHSQLCRTGKFLPVTWPLMTPVLKLPLQLGSRRPSPPLTPPRWLPMHTHCNWRSNVHWVCQLHWDSFLITRLKRWKQYKFILSDSKVCSWWQSCRGEQKNRNLFYKMTDPSLSCHLKLLKHLFCSRGEKKKTNQKTTGQLHPLWAEAYRQPRGCCAPSHSPRAWAEPPSSHTHVQSQLPAFLWLLFSSASLTSR